MNRIGFVAADPVEFGITYTFIRPRKWRFIMIDCSTYPVVILSQSRADRRENAQSLISLLNLSNAVSIRTPSNCIGKRWK